MTWALATIALLLIGFAAISRLLEERNITAPMFFTSAGLLAGAVLGSLDVLGAGFHRIVHRALPLPVGSGDLVTR
jgi:hypothetical protein